MKHKGGDSSPCLKLGVGLRRQRSDKRDNHLPYHRTPGKTSKHENKAILIGQTRSSIPIASKAVQYTSTRCGEPPPPHNHDIASQNKQATTAGGPHLAQACTPLRNPVTPNRDPKQPTLGTELRPHPELHHLTRHTPVNYHPVHLPRSAPVFSSRDRRAHRAPSQRNCQAATTRRFARGGRHRRTGCGAIKL